MRCILLMYLYPTINLWAGPDCLPAQLCLFAILSRFPELSFTLQTRLSRGHYGQLSRTEKPNVLLFTRPHFKEPDCYSLPSPAPLFHPPP